MDFQQLRSQRTTPFNTPAYPLRSTLFTDREYFNVVYRTDVEALRRVVPEPLEVIDPLVRFEVMKMGDVEGYGPYMEAGQVIRVSHNGEEGEYLHAMYLDNVPATIAGRELSAYPKLHGSPRLAVDEGALVGTLDRGSLRVATATMPYKWEPLDHDEAVRQIAAPTFAVKTVTNVLDGSLLQAALVRTQITELTVKQAWTGPARLQLFEHAMAPLADLPVREIMAASHIITDLRLAPVTLAHDYLAQQA